MAKKKSKGKSSDRRSSSSGTMMGMRSGFKSAVGQGKKKRKKGAKELDFVTVLMVVFGIALLVVFIWQMTV